MERYNFGAWLKSELDQRGWSQRELAQRANISNPSTVSMWITGDKLKRPDLANCIAVARVLDMPWQTVLKRAYSDVIPADNGSDEEMDELLYLWKHIKAEDRATVMRMLRGLVAG